MIRRPPRSTLRPSSAASDVYKRQRLSFLFKRCVCVYVCVCVYMCVQMCVCVCKCVCVYTCVCVFVGGGGGRAKRVWAEGERTERNDSALKLPHSFWWSMCVLHRCAWWTAGTPTTYPSAMCTKRWPRFWWRCHSRRIPRHRARFRSLPSWG